MAELYTLPDGWEWKKLDNIVKFSQGIQVSINEQLEEYEEGLNKFIRIINYTQKSNEFRYIREHNEKSYVKFDDIVMIRYGATAGFVGRGLEGIIANNMFRVIPIKDEYLSKDYLYLFLTSNIVQLIISQNIGAAAMPAINFKTMSLIDIPLPPLEEQKRIVAKLDNLFAKIDKAIALHQKNIDEANVFMASVLNDVFVELDEKYGVIKINDVVVKTKNKNPLSEKDTPFTYIDISSIDNKLFKITEPKQLIGSEAPSRAKKEVFQGDIVYSTTRPNLKNIAIVSENYNNPIASTGFCVLRTNQKTINSYLFYFLITEKLFEQIEPNIRGAQYPATSDNDLKNCNIPNTPYQTQQKVVSYLDEISQKMEKIKQIQKEKMQSLKALKASILDQAFKGEL